MKLISFDLQGTLSDSAFSDEFWLELLPALFAKKHEMQVEKAKHYLEDEYNKAGKYNELFYNHRLRLAGLISNTSFTDLVLQLNNQPQLYLDMMNIIEEIPLHIPKIILSATTREFIDLELGDAKKHFVEVFSSIDDFNIPGKPPSLYLMIARKMGIEPQNCLHIGDCSEMDVANANSAGWASFHVHQKQPREQVLAELKVCLNQFCDG